MSTFVLHSDSFAGPRRSLPRLCARSLDSRSRSRVISRTRTGEMEQGPEHAEDVALVQAVLRAEAPAIEQFVERLSFTACALRSLNRRLGNLLSSEDLDDLTQDILVSLWPRLTDYNGSSALETWVYGYCFNGIMNAVRKAQRRKRVEPFQDSQEDRSPSAPDVEELDQVRRSLTRLEERYASVIRMRFFDELSFEQIGARLALPPNTVKTHLYRGLKRLGELVLRREGST